MATQQISTETVGQRIYLVGNTYAVKDALKKAGCHWDGERRQWWIGAAKRANIESLIAQPMPASQDVADASCRTASSRCATPTTTRATGINTRSGAACRAGGHYPSAETTTRRPDGSH